MTTLSKTIMNQTWCTLSTDWKSPNTFVSCCLPLKLCSHLKELNFSSSVFFLSTCDFPSKFSQAKHSHRNTMVEQDQKPKKVSMSAGFYKRPLPSPPAIEFASSHGKVCGFVILMFFCLKLSLNIGDVGVSKTHWC